MVVHTGDFVYHGGIGSYAISLDLNLIIGTNNRDTLFGTSRADEIHGKAGRDRIEGRGGDDFVLANQGNDSVYGDGGDDTMFGGKGEDHIYGGYGYDFCLGQRDDDRLMGKAGHDFLHGGQGDDALIGGEGNDTLAGGRGDDFMRGDQGADLFALNGGGHDEIEDFDFSEGDRLLIPGGVTLVEMRPGISSLPPPPQPVDVNVACGIGACMISWESPYQEYHHISRVLIYRNTNDDFETAVQIGESSFLFYTDRDVEDRQTYYYWVQYENTDGVRGPVSDTASDRTASSPSRLGDDIGDWLDGSPLLKDLQTPIGGGSGTATVTTRLHHADGWVDLVGVDPAEFSYDWLV